MKSATFTVLKNPSETDLSKLLAKAGPSGLRGIEDYNGNVYLWVGVQRRHAHRAKQSIAA